MLLDRGLRWTGLAARSETIVRHLGRDGKRPRCREYAGRASADRWLALGQRASYAVGMDSQGIITIEAGKRGGKPCIRGLRITVYDVLDYLASGMTREQILADLPELTADDIQACLRFAADRERQLLAVLT